MLVVSVLLPTQKVEVRVNILANDFVSISLLDDLE